MKMSKIMRKTKGVVGLDVAEAVIFSLLVIGVVAVASILAMTSLSNSSIFSANSLGANATNQINGNFTGGIVSFFGNSGTFFSILAVVVIIALIALIILYIKNFRGGAVTA